MEGRGREKRKGGFDERGYQREVEMKKGDGSKKERKDHWTMHLQPAVGSSPSPREPGLAPPPLFLPFADFAFSSSSMTSWGLTLICTTFGVESLNRQSVLGQQRRKDNIEEDGPNDTFQG